MGKTTIEINGKRYDAQSGALLGDATQPHPTTRQPLRRQSRVVDGFIAPKKPDTSINRSNENLVAQQLKHSVAPKLAQARMDIKRATPSHNKATTLHKPEKAKTLRRQGLAKPQIDKKNLKVLAPQETPAKQVAVAVPSHKLAAHHVDKQRLVRSRSHRQNDHVRRFTPTQQNHPAKTEAFNAAPIQVSQTPASTPQQIQANTVRPTGSLRHNQATRRPASAHRPAVTRPAQTIAQPNRNKADDIFEAAIANARSHEQPKHKPKRKASHRIVQASAFVAAFIAIAGFVAYLNMPMIEMRIASSKAGFSAHLPDYQPAGYVKEGGVQADHGVVKVSFRSGSSSFTLQQQESNWDSQTLLDNVVALEGKYETHESQGRTIYVYGDKAAWVNGGILYSMKIDGGLNKHDIVAIATSM